MTASLKRLAYRIAASIRLAYWHALKPETHGAKTVVLNGRGEVLLVRHSYSHPDRFMLPGGGVKRGEDADLAAAREVEEETGCRVRDLRLHGTFLKTDQGARNTVDVFVGRTDDHPHVDGAEILEATFWPLAALPPNTSGPSRDRIIEVRDGLPPAPSW